MTPTPLPSPWRNPVFRVWQTGRFLANFAKYLQALVISWQVYQLSKNPLALGMIGLAEAAPFMGFALLAGHVSDRVSKRKVTLASQAGLMLSSVLFLMLSLAGALSLWTVYLVIALIGVCNSFEMASASAYIQQIFTKAEFPRAAAWNLTMFHLAFLGGPLVGGAILKMAGPDIAYVTSLVLFALSVWLMSRTPADAPSAPDMAVSMRRQVMTGLRFIAKERLVLAGMMLDMFAVLFGDAVALFPIFAEMHGAGPMGLGLLRAAPGMGSMAMALFMASRPLPAGWNTLRITVFVYGLCMLGVGWSAGFWMMVFFLVLGGAADSVSVVTRASIYQACTPDALRGRVSAVNGIFISSSNEVGAFESGVAARYMGVVPSVIFGGVMTLLSVGIMSALFPDLSGRKVSGGGVVDERDEESRVPH